MNLTFTSSFEQCSNDDVNVATFLGSYFQGFCHLSNYVQEAEVAEQGCGTLWCWCDLKLNFPGNDGPLNIHGGTIKKISEIC